MQNNFTFI